ncbi:MAG: hypothetical protein Q9160_003336 [Pyrenula sp. 1 TL-2023]
MAPPLKAKGLIGNSTIFRFPDKVKCSVCEKNLMAEKFSKNQRQLYMNVLKQAKDRPVPLIKHPKCTKCTGQQVVEMTCKYCEITKGLDKFSKNQRSNPDNARCWDCCQTHLEELPGTESVEAEELKDCHVDTSSYAQSFSLEGLTNASKKLSLKENRSYAESVGSSALAAVEDDDTIDDDNDAVWVNQNEPLNTYQTSQRKASTFTAYDNDGIAHRQQRTPSIAPSETGTEWDNFTTVERSSRKSHHSGTNVSASDRFAKVRPTKITKAEIHQAREERVKNAEVSRNEAIDDEDEESDSDEELPY